MEHLYFCQIPYYDFYDGTEAPDDPTCMNFLPVEIYGEDGNTHEVLFGALPHAKSLPQALHEMADCDGIIHDASVVFCAKAQNGSIVTVGWYRHANITLSPEYLPMTDEEGGDFEHPFYFCTTRDCAVLLPIEVRFQPSWQIPRAKAGRGAQRARPGISNESLWIPGCEAQTFIRTFSESMISYESSGDNLLLEDSNTAQDDSSHIF